MSQLAWVHVGSAGAAVAAGAVVLFLPKGACAHRALGWIYVISMVALNGSALQIYRLFESFGPFHAAALISLATLAPGVSAAVLKGPRFVERHYYFMSFSYVGLLAALVSEVLVRTPKAPFWGAVALASTSVLLAGALLIAHRARAVLGRFTPNANDPPLKE